jgi:hypothetical protein
VLALQNAFLLLSLHINKYSLDDATAATTTTTTITTTTFFSKMSPKLISSLHFCLKIASQIYKHIP